MLRYKSLETLKRSDLSFGTQLFLCWMPTFAAILKNIVLSTSFKLVFTFIFSLVLSFSVSAQNHDNGHDHDHSSHEHDDQHLSCEHAGDHGQGEFDPGATAFHHIADANVYSIGPLQIPLPCILYNKN